MTRIACLLIIVQLSAIQTLSQSNKFETHTFDNGAEFKLPYRFYQPKNMQPDKKYPLVIFLHGAGDWGTDNKSQLANFPYSYIDSTNSAGYPCYFVAPQCTESSPWSSFPDYPGVRTLPDPTKSTLQVLSLIDTLLDRDTVKIDKSRIYVTGFSLGGEGAFDIITRKPDLFAAAIPICGIADTSKAPLMKNTPLWIFHGSKDNVNDVNYSRIIVAALKKIGKEPKYTEYEGLKHDIWSKAYNDPELLPWLFSQNKGTTARRNENMRQPVRAGGSVSLTRADNILRIAWTPSAHPDLIELFSLSGKCSMRKNVAPSSCNEYVLDFSNNGRSSAARFIVRVSSGKKTVYVGVR